MIAYRGAAAPFLPLSIAEFDKMRNMAYLTIGITKNILKITKVLLADGQPQ